MLKLTTCWRPNGRRECQSNERTTSCNLQLLISDPPTQQAPSWPLAATGNNIANNNRHR